MKIIGKPLEIFNQITEYLEKQKEDKELVVYIANSETKEIRTLQQNKTFYKLFTDIWNHLWEKKDDVKEMLLAWVFWTRLVKIWKIEKEVNIEKHTSELTKEQWIKFIDTILAFCEREKLPITITSREIESLYNSY